MVDSNSIIINNYCLTNNQRSNISFASIYLSDYMKEIVRRINKVFVTIVLFFFYFVVFGLGYFIYRLFNRPKHKEDSYWLDPDEKKLTIDYFQSPY